MYEWIKNSLLTKESYRLSKKLYKYIDLIPKKNLEKKMFFASFMLLEKIFINSSFNNYKQKICDKDEIVNFQKQINECIFIDEQTKQKNSKIYNCFSVYTPEIEINYLNINIKKPDLIHSFILHICYFLFTFSSQKKCSITLLANKEKKKLNSSIKLIGPNEINSGSTSFSNFYNPDPNYPNPILIWREEEMFKVLIHELLHSFLFDDKLRGINTDPIKKLFKVPKNMEIRLSEAYTETWAVFLNSLIIASQYKKSWFKFQEILRMEMLFSCFQIAKVLLFFGFSDIHDFYKSKNNNKLKNFQQKTSVFSYCIIKGALLFSIDKFLIFCDDNNDSSIFLFNKDKDSYNKYISLIENCWDNIDFQLCINKCITLLIRLRKNKKNRFLCNTLRLTCVELKNIKFINKTI